MVLHGTRFPPRTKTANATRYRINIWLGMSSGAPMVRTLLSTDHRLRIKSEPNQIRIKTDTVTVLKHSILLNISFRQKEQWVENSHFLLRMMEDHGVVTRSQYARSGCTVLYKNHRKLTIVGLLQVNKLHFHYSVTYKFTFKFTYELTY